MLKEASVSGDAPSRVKMSEHIFFPLSNSRFRFLAALIFFPYRGQRKCSLTYEEELLSLSLRQRREGRQPRHLWQGPVRRRGSTREALCSLDARQGLGRGSQGATSPPPPLPSEASTDRTRIGFIGPSIKVGRSGGGEQHLTGSRGHADHLLTFPA